MTKMIEHFFGIIIITFANMYIWTKLLEKRPKIKSLKTIIVFVLMAVITLLNYFYNNQFIRILTITIVMAIFIKILMKEKINRAILASVTAQIIYMISEIIFAIIISTVFSLNANDIANTQFATLAANFAIVIIAIIIVNFPITVKFYKFLLRITSKVKNVHLVIFVFLVTLIANVLAMTVYYKVDFSYLLLFNTLLTLFCISIVFYSFRTKNNYIKVYDKYNTTLNSLKEYENILDRYRISNHENKNQLLTVRNMISKNNKKAIDYIDTIVENKLKDNDRVMVEASKIPTGGLRGLIYSKVLLMKKLKINYELEISNDVRTVDLISKIDDSTMLDICKVIGVYLDNAIQSVEKLKSKYINIEMYLEESMLVISVSNNYKGIIELDKIEDSGYTSKGSGHGYGLALTKEIIESNSKLSNEKSIAKDTFTQILKIKM